jgi:alkaline phosphatase D
MKTIQRLLVVLLTAAAALAAAAATTDAELASSVLAGPPGAIPLRDVVPGPQYFDLAVASGDPRPDSVVLWTRLNDPAARGAALHAELFVVREAGAGRLVVVARRPVLAEAANDFCVKTKVTGLDPYTVYRYFFAYARDGKVWVSTVGRTKTAPAPGQDVPVRFAYFNCQDFVGRYNNTYLRFLLAHPDDVDFIVHLGDMVYETTGDPSFQTPDPARQVTFTDLASAIALGDPLDPYYAAASLSNYRELHRTYRGDPVLQQVLASFPILATWDDHEYSNDAWGDTATYFDERIDERNTARKRNAERAYFEYVPVDVGIDGSGRLVIDDGVLYPNTRLYRSFRFGTNVDLFLTDTRTRRPDHLIREDAFPGAIALDRAALEAALGPAGYQAAKGTLDPYAPIEQFPPLRAGMVAIVTQLLLLENPLISPSDAVLRAQALVSGNQSITFVNALFAAVGLPAPFPPGSEAAFDRGLSYLYLGKQRLYSSVGSRSILVHDGYKLLSAILYRATAGATEDLLGAEQERWLRESIPASGARFKVVGSSISATSKVLDFTNPLIAPLLPPGFPAALRTRLQITADDWDGFPDKRRELVELLRGAGGGVVISGDIHAAFVGDHGAGVYEFTGPAASSESFRDEVLNVIESDPSLSGIPGIGQLVAQLDLLLTVSSQDPAVTPSRIAFSDTGSSGFVVMTATADGLTATYHLIDAVESRVSYYADPGALEHLFSTRSFRVQDGVLTPLP